MFTGLSRSARIASFKGASVLESPGRSATSAAVVVSALLAVTLGCSDKALAPLDERGGCPGAVYPEWRTSPYVLPIPVGETAYIDLSHCSGSFHSAGEPDEFGIDFDLAVGSLITASRAGTVVWVEESGYDGGFPNNVVVVDHGDGTYAQYMHLTRDGAIAEVGDELESGAPVGYSGVTGYAGYPHLHFIVTADGFDYPYRSIPTTFRNTGPNPRSLLSGLTYVAEPY